MWFASKGVLKYGPGNRAVMNVDQGIADFYLALVPAWVGACHQRYRAHVSFVRHIQPPDMSAWGKHDGECVDFEYNSEVSSDATYLWLDVRCPRLIEVRVELGLPPYPSWRNGYHLTIGNLKEWLS
jgi:hypothetical protein